MSLKSLLIEAVEDWDFSWSKKAINKKIFRKVEKISKQKDFQEWFGDSELRYEDGSPMILFHGTDEKFDSFDNKRGETGFTFFSSDPYEGTRYGETVKVCLVKAKNLYDIHNNKEEQKYLLDNYEKIIESASEDQIETMLFRTDLYNEMRRDDSLKPVPTDVITKEFFEFLLTDIDVWSVIETPFVIDRIKSGNFEGYISPESGVFNIGLLETENKVLIIQEL